MIYFLLLSVSACAFACDSEKKWQEQFDLVWQLTQAELALRKTTDAPKRRLTNYLKAAEHDPRWCALRALPDKYKSNFLLLIRHRAINNPDEYATMRQLIAGCAWAGCTFKPNGFDEERLVKLIHDNDDHELLNIPELSHFLSIKKCN